MDGDGPADASGQGLESVLRPVRSGNAFEETLQRILQLVRLGLVPDGGRLPAERELAERLQVSRVTLREALKVLQDEGLLETRRGRYGGAFVHYRPKAVVEEGDGSGDGAELRRRARRMGHRLEDTLLFREVLEVGAAELCAARRPTGEQARLLRDCLAATGSAAPADYRRADTRLHLAIAELCGSASVAEQYASVRASVNELLDCIPLLPRNLDHSQAQHSELVAAVLDGDREKARSVMREHIAGTAALLRGFLS
jgi:DNA-binding FadR family transcriptional regulator